MALNKPVVLVTCNYRLNIFAFGDGRGERNLALQDQRLAIDWVARNITAFGGDKVRPTDSTDRSDAGLTLTGLSRGT